MIVTARCDADGKWIGSSDDSGRTIAFEVGVFDVDRGPTLYVWRLVGQECWSPTYSSKADAIHAAVQYLKGNP